MRPRATHMVLILAALTSLTAAASAQGHTYSPWLHTPQRYEGATKSGEHLDAAVSRDGHQVVEIALVTRARCTGPSGIKTEMLRFDPPPGLYGFKPARVGANGQFGWIVTNPAYHGAPSRTTIRGQLLDGGALMRVKVTRSVNHDLYKLSRRKWISRRCSVKSVLTALRWAPADWTGTTSQSTPFTFHVGAFEVIHKEGQTLSRAPITGLRTRATVACENGQSITQDFNGDAYDAAANGAYLMEGEQGQGGGITVFISGSFGGEGGGSPANQPSVVRLSGRIVWALKGRTATTIAGTLEMSTYLKLPGAVEGEGGIPETRTIECPPTKLAFSAHAPA